MVVRFCQSIVSLHLARVAMSIKAALHVLPCILRVADMEIHSNTLETIGHHALDVCTCVSYSHKNCLMM
jgi:hypothetical protein